MTAAQTFRERLVVAAKRDVPRIAFPDAASNVVELKRFASSLEDIVARRAEFVDAPLARSAAAWSSTSSSPAL